MAKRHAALVPIARDHHDGLLLAVRLQQGDRAELKLWSHDPNQQRAYVLAFVEQSLQRHFDVEEKVVFRAATAIPAAAPVVKQLIEEHRRLMTIAQDLRSAPAEGLPELLRAFGVLLEAHIRLEDRTLFPVMEEQLGDEPLNTLEASVRPYYP